MTNEGSIGKVIGALERAFVSSGTEGKQGTGEDGTHTPFLYAFCCGESGGIAAAASIFGVKALELCDDISDALEDNDADFLHQILQDLKERTDVGAATNSGSHSAGSLPVLAGALAEAVRSHNAGDRQRFALMSGFAVGLMFANPEPGPALTEAEVVEGAIHYYRAMANWGELEATLVDYVVSGVLLARLEAVVGTRDDRTMTTRDAVIRAYEADCVELTEWLRSRLISGARHTDPMSSMSNNDEAERYFEEEVRTIRWIEHFGLRRERTRYQDARVPNYMLINRAIRQMTTEELEDLPRPIEMCYWVVPGRLLAGEYPRNLDEPSSMEKLARLTDAGVSTFIDLTEEGEGLKPYAHLLNGSSHERFAIRDRRVPATDELTKAALDAIDRHLEDGETVYVHCWGGVGRTGTIIGSWLSRHYEPGQAALDRLRELWKDNPKSGWRPRSPENGEQERYVREWGDKEISVAARYQGCLTGLAVGDAMGTTVEFRPPGTFERVSDMVGGGTFRFATWPVDRRHVNGPLPGREPGDLRWVWCTPSNGPLCSLVAGGISEQHRKLLRHRQCHRGCPEPLPTIRPGAGGLDRPSNCRQWEPDAPGPGCDVLRDGSGTGDKAVRREFPHHPRRPHVH